MNTYETTYGAMVPVTTNVRAEMLESIAGYEDKSRLIAELYHACGDGENGLQESDVRWLVALGHSLLEHIEAEKEEA